MKNVHLINDEHDEVKTLLETSPNLNKKFVICDCDDESKCDFIIHCYEYEDKLETADDTDKTYHLDLDELRSNPREITFTLLSTFPDFWCLDYKIFLTLS
jgi:hypothetical protein